MKLSRWLLIYFGKAALWIAVAILMLWALDVPHNLPLWRAGLAGIVFSILKRLP